LDDGSILVGGIASGRVLRLSRNGWSTFFRGAPDVYSVTALRFDAGRNLVWGASPDVLAVFAGDKRPRSHRVFALDATTGRLVRSVEMPPGAFANDLALDERGGVYVTDSLGGRIWHVSAGGSDPRLVVHDPRFRGGALGPAGIVRTSEGDLLVGLFSAGELYRVRSPDARPVVGRVNIERPIERLDGLALASDGRLLAVEGGRGSLLAIELSRGTITTLATGLSGPVNLTISRGDVWVTESGINDPSSFDPLQIPPSGFSLRRVPLSSIVSTDVPPHAQPTRPDGLSIEANEEQTSDERITR
jgi:sugar lactone lactonase YvrE